MDIKDAKVGMRVVCIKSKLDEFIGITGKIVRIIPSRKYSNKAMFKVLADKKHRHIVHGKKGIIRLYSNKWKPVSVLCDVSKNYTI